MNNGYIRRQKLGEGTYAKIYLADEVKTLGGPRFITEDEECIKTGLIVAIKVIKRTDYCPGLEISAVREIKTLKKIDCPFVLRIYDVFIHEMQINMVLEYMETNLEDIIKDKSIIIMPQDIKAWMLMILKGIYACHKKFIVHRDIKPNNILISKSGIIKIADFGLAREIDALKMTPTVVTRWYRAPELIFGCRLYTFAIDIWSIGCVFAELFLRTPYFPSETDIGHLELIFKALGTPSEDDWPGMSKLPNYLEYPVYTATPLKNLFTAASDDAIELLEKMLVYNPVKRIGVSNALKHRYFTEKPRPSKTENLPFIK